ncbi:hypothetical protein ANCCEY_13540 [Ancylostoma ceylanicum]|uniref:Uncharacterized protein n=1 Tax=Ancylostoma ceylanicum TaxID=53326 RepID=A0A0D6L8L7_9BILA|nr:hypothetical protein ANCCEY_13540 [Ancylostoma ceylanicum]
MTGRTDDYFKGLPDSVRGVSKWENGHAKVYTKNLVFNYNRADSSVVLLEQDVRERPNEVSVGERDVGLGTDW